MIVLSDCFLIGAKIDNDGEQTSRVSWQPAEIDTSGPPLRLNAAHQRPGYPGSSFIYLVYKNKPHLKYMNEQFLGRRTFKMASYDGRINFSLLVGNINSFCI